MGFIKWPCNLALAKLYSGDDALSPIYWSRCSIGANAPIKNFVL